MSTTTATATNFTDLVRRSSVITSLDARSAEHALKTMAGRLVQRGNCAESFVHAILERERLYPSGLPMRGPKIAIPHADAHHVRRSTILFARLARPVEFRSMGDPDQRLSVRMISMFALREKHAIGDLLETLISVYQDASILNQLLEADDADDMYSTLREAVRNYSR